jgi:hypothetical protein
MTKGRFDYMKILGLLLIGFYIITAINNQITYIFKPFFESYKNIPSMLFYDDIGQLKQLYYPIYKIVDEINKYPQDTNFYFTPCFEDSNNTESWWYLYIRVRYVCYPRKIFVNSPLLYNGSKKAYRKHFVGDSKQYDELDWIKNRNIDYVILFRNNTVSILPIDSEIVL